jgi:hypothetical protein
MNTFTISSIIALAKIINKLAIVKKPITATAQDNVGCAVSNLVFGQWDSFGSILADFLSVKTGW